MFPGVVTVPPETGASVNNPIDCICAKAVVRDSSFSHTGSSPKEETLWRSMSLSSGSVCESSADPVGEALAPRERVGHFFHELKVRCPGLGPLHVLDDVGAISALCGRLAVYDWFGSWRSRVILGAVLRALLAAAPRFFHMGPIAKLSLDKLESLRTRKDQEPLHVRGTSRWRYLDLVYQIL